MITRELEQAIVARHGLRQAGAPLARAKSVLLAVHGRGADASSILSLAEALAQPDIAFIAPQAEGGSWYPRPFIAPLEDNQPFLSRSLARILAILDEVSSAGVPAKKLGLLGFSQGACLAAEAALQRPAAYGCIIVLSGGYIGPPNATPRRCDGSLAGARAFIGCSDIDPHIPLQRVGETAALMRAMGADVTERIYRDFGHSVNDDEIAQCRKLLVAMQDDKG
jgi:phospholipase/carboxylesterase